MKLGKQNYSWNQFFSSIYFKVVLLHTWDMASRLRVVASFGWGLGLPAMSKTHFSRFMPKMACVPLPLIGNIVPLWPQYPSKRIVHKFE
jgi:hypothetical protein